MYKPALTSMRGIAALLVVFYHTVEFKILPPNPIFLFGWSGVNFFFVLSGYLLASLYSSVNLRYFVRRVFRTFPLYYLTIPLYLWANYSYVSLWWIFYAQNFFWPDSRGPQWTLTLEEMFYFLILPLLFILRNRVGQRWRMWFFLLTLELAGLSVLWGVFAGAHPIPSTPSTLNLSYFDANAEARSYLFQQMPFYLFDFVLGVSLSGIVLPKAIRTRMALLGILLFILSAIILRQNQNNIFSPILTGITYSSLILGLEENKLLESKPLEILGKSSYAIYLFQVPFLVRFGFYGIFVTLLISVMSYLLFESKTMKLGDALLKRVKR